jgi:heme exporter protein A
MTRIQRHDNQPVVEPDSLPGRLRLSASGLLCRRGGRVVFSGVNFSLLSGEALAVTGRNGSGKSSLLRMIAGLLNIAGGRLALEGGEPERSIGEQAHYLAHHDTLKPSLSVAENLRFWIDYLGGRGAPETALAALGLETLADFPAAYLSAGQRRRLSLARLAAIARPVWLLDEPAAGLDAPAQITLDRLMRDHLAGGGIIVAATHAPLAFDLAQELRLGAAS